MIKFLLAITLLVGTSEALKCLVDGTSTACETKCLGPIYVGNLASGLSNQQQVCAATADTLCPALSCASCNTDDCNVKPEVTDYKCDTYTWSTDKYVKGAETAQQTCKKVKGKHGSCKTPGENAKLGDALYFTGLTACQACSELAVKAKTCATVSSARAVGALLMPLIALFYTLF